jgi:syntaxin 1B/2/3
VRAPRAAPPPPPAPPPARDRARLGPFSAEESARGGWGAGKHEDLVRLEASIKEVHQLFMDMALMVEMQGELLDNVEEAVSRSAEYTEQGVVQLQEAKRLQKKARKKMCCLAACFAVMLLIVLSFVTNFLIPRI